MTIKQEPVFGGSERGTTLMAAGGLLGQRMAGGVLEQRLHLALHLALIALAGLQVNFFWNVKRADSIAALAIIPLIVFEARKALRGKPCACV